MIESWRAYRHRTGREYLLALLAAHDYHCVQAAKAAGMRSGHFYRMLETFDIDVNKLRAADGRGLNHSGVIVNLNKFLGLH